MLTVGAHLYNGQFKEIVVERVLIHGKVVAVAVLDGTVERQRGTSAIAQAHHIHCVGVGGAYSIFFGTKGHRSCFRVAQIARTAHYSAARSPTLDACVVELHGSAALCAHSTAEGSHFGLVGVADGVDGLRVGVGIHPVVPDAVVGAVYYYARSRVSPAAEVAVVHLLVHACRHGTIHRMLPPTVLRLA